MKKFKTEIHFILLVFIIIIMNLLVSCSSSRHVVKDQTITQAETKTYETVKTDLRSVTHCDLFASSTSTITETIDTTVTITDFKTRNPALDEFLKNNPLVIPVKKKRVEQKQEFSNKKEEVVTNEIKVEQKKTEVNQKSTVEKKEVKTKSVPSFVFFFFLFFILAAILFFAWKFVKNRFL
jgi:hypothetical protein